MATKIKKNFGASIIGVLNISEDGIISVDVEDIGEVAIADFISEFADKEVKISVTYSDEEF